MKINLRKANVVQEFLLKEFRRLKKQVSATLTISIYDDDPNPKINKQAADYHALNAQLRKLLEARQIIRALVGHKNAEAGLYELLAEDYTLGLLEAHLDKWKDESPRLSDEGNLRQLKGAAEPAKIVRYGTEDQTFNVLPAEDIDAIKQEYELVLKKRRKLQDKMIEVNLMHHITLPPQVASLLIELDLD